MSRKWVILIGVTSVFVIATLAVMTSGRAMRQPKPARSQDSHGHSESVLPPCPPSTVEGSLPRSYRGMCLGWTWSYVQTIPGMKCFRSDNTPTQKSTSTVWFTAACVWERESISSDVLASLPETWESILRDVGSVTYYLRSDEVKEIQIQLQPQLLNDVSFDQIFERAKQAYGEPVSEKVPLATAMHLRERSGEQTALGLVVKGVVDAWMRGAHVTIWKDDYTVVSLLYLPEGMKPTLSDLREQYKSPMVGIVFDDRATKEAVETEQRKREQTIGRDREQMFTK